jgi:Protein of unknown function (DUF3179)
MTVSKSRRRALAALAVVLGFLAFVAMLIQWLLGPEPFGGADAGPVGGVRFDHPARYLPPTLAAAKAGLSAEEPVIGVRIAGRSRAYCRRVLEGPGNHVINDMIGNRPVTVTYCERKRCARVYSGEGTNPLHIRTGGYDDGLLLIIGAGRYRQDSGAPVEQGTHGALPYSSIEFVETTWGRWRSDHPDTDIVTGVAPTTFVGG